MMMFWANTKKMRRAALITSMLLLGACGFEPLHGQQYRSSLAVDLSALKINVTGSNTSLTGTGDMVPHRYDELLKAEITDQVNPHGTRAEKHFNLNISYSEQQAAQFVNPDGTASRGDVIYTSGYTISRLSDGKQIASGSLTTVSSFNSSPTADYASYVSIEDARQRGIVELAQQYKLRLAALLPTLNDPHASDAKLKPVDAVIPELQPTRDYETFRAR